MSALLTYVLGVLTGLVIFWIGYQILWRHWNKHHNRDKAYLQEKIRSEQSAKIGLERQLTAFKAEAAGLQSRIGEMDRLIRQAELREEQLTGEKKSLVTLLDALRAELAIYQKITAETEHTPALTIFPHTNGKKNGNGAKAEAAPVAVPEFEVVLAHTNGNGSGKPKNGSGKITPHYGLGSDFPPADPLTEPVMYIERPRMKGDRLEIIPGINPALLAKLRQDGIDTFAGLSSLTAEELIKIAGPRMGKRIDAQGILVQAKKMAGGRKHG